MSTTAPAPVDMIRLAALLGRFDADHGGACETAGCVHLTDAVAAARIERETPRAA
jgi:hypothetical protein